ncbi:hypothetical protein DL96DRAFT_1819218 [Flagelloscypha sp. PMI_526]|nr:hypothetical protein DL96DRAFT_1819218 [Flagelloscypha sp. PMI_526]
MPAAKPPLSSEAGLRLLAFDGGGIRAISQALIVRDMLHRLEEDHQLSRPAKVSDYFDMVCGSGLGGLLAIMCGVLHMTGDQLVEEFIRLCKAVFPSELDIEQRTCRLEEEIKRIISNFSEGREDRRMLDENNMCKTFVCTAPANNTSHARLIRSYRSRTNASPDCLAWEAARATTATPGLFFPISIGPEYIGETLVSGELGWNNPTDELIEEAARLFKGRYITCIVNIGSGHPGHLSLSNGLSDLFSRIALDCERAAEKMERRFGEVPGVYRRLNTEQGMQNLDVDLLNLHEVVSHTQSYLQGSQTTRNIDDLLQDLALRPERILVDMISGIVKSTAEVLHPTTCPQPTVYFTGRWKILQIMEEYFFSTGDSCCVCVLYGIGGGGKTQIALKFIQQSDNRFSEIFFIDASDKLTLENGLIAIASRSMEKPSVDDALRLLQTRRESWLLFLDNADDTTLDLRPYVSWAHGNVLITTRNRNVRTHAPKCNIWVDKLEVEDATDLLLRGVDVHIDSEAHGLSLKIVHELGYLALAINQARAFLATGLCALVEYLPIYMQNRKRLLEDKSIQTTDDYEHTVYTTWTISFNKLSHDAALLLRLLSYMHHESVPCRLFEYAWSMFEEAREGAVPPIVVAFLSSFTAVDSTWDVLRFRQLIGEILSFSLVEFNAINYSISLHPLVQQWAQHHSQHHQDIIPATQTLLSLAVLEEVKRQEYMMTMSLLPHLRESMNSGAQLHFSLLIYAGFVYRRCGMFQENLRFCQTALFETRQQLGPENPDTLDCMTQLATAYWNLGQNRIALKLNEEGIELRKRVLGDEHPDTLATMSNLALVYSDLGQCQDALKLNKEALEPKKRVLGDEHPETLTTMSNLALVYSDLGQYHDALKLNKEALELKKRVLGDEHPDTLATMNALALVYSRLGQYQDALKLNKEALELKKRVLGDEHPDTLKAMNNLALIYSDLGQYQDALKLNKETLELMGRVLGDEHPDTLATMSNLALVYSRLGQYHDALKLNKETLELKKRVLGDEHPDTLATMSNLALICSDLGQYQVALKLDKETLELRKRVLGDEHPDTLATMSNLALGYSDLGQYQDALKLNKETLELRKRVLGDEHPNTVTSMNNLAFVYSSLGRFHDALQLHEEVLERRCRILGSEHPYTIFSTAQVEAPRSQLQANDIPNAQKPRKRRIGTIKRLLHTFSLK